MVMTEAAPANVWRIRGFVLYWTSATVSMAGSSVTAVVLPLVCAALLDASPAQMSALFAIGIAAPLLLQVGMGSWADRTTSHRAVMCSADLTAGVAIAVVPGLWLLDLLNYASVLVVMAVVAILGVLRNSVSIPVLLKVVPVSQLVDANGLMNSSRSAMEVVGKGVAGALLTVMAAPLTLLADAVSFLAASALGARIPMHAAEGGGASAAEPVTPTRLGEVLGGLRVRRDLWSLVLIALVNGVTEAVFLLYCLQDLALSPALVAALFALGAVGGIAGGLMVGHIVKRGGTRWAVVLGVGATVASLAPLPFVAPGVGAVVAVVGFEFLGALGGTVAIAAVFSDIQMAAPANAVARTMAVTDNALQLATLAGVGVGGMIGQLVALEAAIVVALTSVTIAGIPLALSCLRSAEATE